MSDKQKHVRWQGVVSEENVSPYGHINKKVTGPEKEQLVLYIDYIYMCIIMTKCVLYNLI